MWPNIIRPGARCRRGFTIVETLLATVVSIFVILSVWSVFMMTWQWWSEMEPRITCQKLVRLGLLSIIEGAPDSTTGTFTVGTTTYKRRSGIAWAVEYPDISTDGKTISYRLEPDSSNTRQFYYGTYNGKGVIYYRDGNGTARRIDATLGITDLKFEKFVDSGSTTHDNIIKVTVTAEKDIPGARTAPFNVKVVFSDTVYLRNAL